MGARFRTRAKWGLCLGQAVAFSLPILADGVGAASATELK